MKVLIVADDLTGALDSAVVFAHCGMRCCVVRSAAAFATCDVSGFDVVAVSTGSRDGCVDRAREKVAMVADAMTGRWPDYVFKKVDSRLKGHIGAETAVLMRDAGRRLALIAPAIPDMGRVTAAGHVSGAGVGEPIAIAPLFGIGGKLSSIPDIRSGADFDGPLAKSDPGETVYVGARGLAAALARKLAPAVTERPRERLEAPALFAIGSRDPITEAQVDELRGNGTIGFHAAPNGAFPASGGLAAGVTLVKLTAGLPPVGAGVAGRRFADGAADFVRRRRPATLLACGGETANAILQQLNVEMLEVKSEILPGVAVAKAVIFGKMTSIVTKSGGFGAISALADLASAVESFETEAMTTESGS